MPPPRLLPVEPFPAYAFVPGRLPHPISDPQGHSYGHEAATVEPLDPRDWRRSPFYLRAIDLFNHGYYWEAHESWESLWHACGRKGVLADFLKGLIRLAAAGVKVRERRPAGLISHATAAESYLTRVAYTLGSTEDRYCGLSLTDLCAYAQQAREVPILADREELPPVEIVFSFALSPSP
jgi:uncharacterized protein